MHKRYVGLYYYKYDTNMTCRKYIRKIKNKLKCYPSRRPKYTTVGYG